MDYAAWLNDNPLPFAKLLGVRFTSATILNLQPGANTTTIESKTNFMAPAMAGSTVTGECIALHRGRRTMVWQTRITSQEGRLMAIVIQTQMVIDSPPNG